MRSPSRCLAPEPSRPGRSSSSLTATAECEGYFSLSIAPRSRQPERNGAREPAQESAKHNVFYRRKEEPLRGRVLRWFPDSIAFGLASSLHASGKGDRLS